MKKINIVSGYGLFVEFTNGIKGKLIEIKREENCGDNYTVRIEVFISSRMVGETTVYNVAPSDIKVYATREVEE